MFSISGGYVILFFHSNIAEKGSFPMKENEGKKVINASHDHMQNIS